MFSHTTDIYERYHTTYTAPCNGVVNNGAQFGGLRDFPNNTRKSKHKTNTVKIFTFSHFMRVCLHAQTYAPDKPRLF